MQFLKGKEKTAAIIPAREGSKGVYKKNIRLLAGYPLIAYSIVAASITKEIERVIISTDSKEIAEIGRFFGAEVPFLRPAQYANDKSPDIEFVMHAIEWLKENEGGVPEYLVHLRPTTPLRSPDVITSAIVEICNSNKATSLRSGHPASESPLKWFIRDENGYFKGIRTGASNDENNMPRQSFPTVYIPDGYVDVLKTSFICNTGTLYGENMIGFVSPVCHEVDTIEDFEYLEFEINRKGSLLLDYLREKYPKEE